MPTEEQDRDDRGGEGLREERSGERRRPRKERVLHTRISEDLAEDIRRMADELRVPVSNIVRNVLEEAFSVVETVTGNVGDLIEDVVDEAEAARDRLRERQRQRRRRQGRERSHKGAAAAADVPGEHGSREFPEVLGWQPLFVERARECAECGAQVGRGDQAFVGVTASGLGATTLCEPCMGARR